GDDALYVATYARDGAHRTWPKRISAAESEHFADALYKVTQGANMGWPYTFYDSARHVRLLQPEYGGNGTKPVTDSKYAVPVTAFHAHVAPMDIAFYDASQFPAHYRDGAFIAMHGADSCDVAGFNGGYDVMFVPMSGDGRAGPPERFASGFAGPTHADLCAKVAAYRPVGVAVGPNGALYIADSQKGRIWRISYGKN
ncbi:MAG: PQQ-dependent sugar dehydrogenase, partial [Terriglobales bacterium]